MSRTGAHSGQVALLCHGNVLSCSQCVTLGTVGLRKCESWLDELYTHVGNYTENVIFMVFWFSLCQGYMANKRRHYSAELTAPHMFHGHCSTREWVVHIVDNLNFCDSFLHNSWIWAQFDHLAAPLGFISSVHRALTNTETMLFGVCFRFPICILTDVECCMTSTKDNTTVLEVQQCTFSMLQ